MMPGDMHLVATSASIDLTKWGLADIEWIGPVHAKTVTDVLREEFNNHPPSLDFAFQYSPKSDGRCGPAVTDPVMMYVDLPLSGQDGNNNSWAVSLEECVDSVIEYYCHGETKKIESENGRRICTAIAARLRELAQKLDAATVEP